MCYDRFGQVRDFYYPYVGQENHVGEKLRHKVGVEVDGTVYWLDHDTFKTKVQYEDNTLVGHIEAVSEKLNLTLRFGDLVYNEHDIFIRTLTIENTADFARTIKVFFNQQFHISESSHGDTGYYSADLRAVLHYKGRRVFLASLRDDDDFFEEYSVGLMGIEGKEGTWRDAEDGVLSQSPIEHGTVDSVIAKSAQIGAGASHVFYYWIAAGTTYKQVERTHRDILTRGPMHLYHTTESYWRAWVNRRELTTCEIDPSLIDLYRRSLLVMRTHVDNEGAIIASGDSSILQAGRDTYSYCWPRDGAYVALAFLEAGHSTASTHFHELCSRVLTEDGYLLHKYRADSSLGASWHPWVRNGRTQPPIQEDETAITLISLRKQYELNRDVEYIESVFNTYIKRAADFLTRYRDKKTGLPLPSHDLWEEQFGVFTYTAASVYAGLVAAAYFAELLGKPTAQKRWSEAAEEVKDGILTQLVHEDGRVMKVLRYENHTQEPDYTVDASSFYGLFAFGVLPVGDRRLEAMYSTVRDRLSIKSAVGGIARYEGDNYYRNSHDVPGNPWIITTLWLAEYEMARAQSAADLEAPLETLRWVVRKANCAGLLSEQYDPVSGDPVSVMPLTWSHAGYVRAFLAYVRRLRELGICVEKPTG